ncbi:MAG: methyl-accepting chemotaxis protein [Lachnospiraceae bacterium]
MKNKSVNRKLADKQVRLKVANKYMYIGGLFAGVFSLLMLILAPGMFGKDNRIFVYIEAALTALYAVYGLFFNFLDKNHPTAARRGQVYIQLAIYIVANLGSGNIAVLTMVYGLLIIAIMYEHVLMIDCCSYTIFVLGIIKIAYMWKLSSPVTTDMRNEYIAQLMVVGVLTFATDMIARLNDAFNRAAKAVLLDEKDEQKRILDEVLEVAEVVQKGSMDVGNIISKLKESSENVSLSIEEISNGNQNTCESVEHQSRMTQSISESINMAAEKTNEMAEAFLGVEKEVRRGMELMKLLDSQSDVIEEKSELAVEAMGKLSRRTTDMADFTEEILNISSQTNLLALNASIEAARAGEAGKGFAVVADEIRELSDATRQTTEKIATLIKELNAEAEYVSEAVGMAKEAVTTQNQAIADTGSAFSNVGDSVENLNDLVMGIKESASELLVSNNEIIDSISQLSAVTQEVTASSDAVSRIADENRESAVDANGKLNEVIHIFQRLDEFTKKE